MSYNKSSVWNGMRSYDILNAIDNDYTYSTSIAGVTPMQQSDVSDLLNVMKDCDLLESERNGRRNDYSMTERGERLLELKKEERKIQFKAKMLVYGKGVE